MEFICNRWVYTGDCKHKREQRVKEEMERRRRIFGDKESDHE